jgi:hypothetical protein
MRRMILAVLAGLALLTTGCQTETGNQVKAAVVAGVAYYCAQPKLARVALRETIAAQTFPNRAEIHCAADE